MRPRYIRIIIVALIWIAFQSAIGGYIHGNSLGQIIANHMPLGGFFFLIILVFVVNPMMRGLAKGTEFSPKELAIMWIMIMSASAVPGYGMMEFLFPYIAAPLYFARPENQWQEIILPKLPEWAYLSDKSAVRDFFRGTSGGSVPWKAWLAPAGFWITFSLTFFFVFTCWGAILRKQWVERERYVFPLVQVPAQLIQPKTIFRGRLIWIGIAIPFVLHLLNGLSMYFPHVPHIGFYYPLNALLTEKPWNELVSGWALTVIIYFSVMA